MSHREDALAILHFKDPMHMPIVHFGFWRETVVKWRDEGHLTAQEAIGIDYGDSGENAQLLGERLGFDFNWYTTFGGTIAPYPPFAARVIEELPDGYQKVLNEDGVVLLEKKGTVSIPSEIDHILKDRESWETEFLPRLQYTDRRIDWTALKSIRRQEDRLIPLGLNCGSLYGTFRNWVGLEGSCYLQADDKDLFCEILDTHAALQLRLVEEILRTGARFDFGHFWEDICFKGGPLVNPVVLRERVGPWYRRFAELLGRYGIDIISLDCDGLIDELIPVWLENGVNTMFPIEVGTWNASIEPWRKKYGRAIRGVGGMDKRVFAQDYQAIEREIQRLQRLVDLGGFIPCPDHRIAPDAKWENVQYYTDRLRRVFS
jgi:hypothetical protein